LNQKPVCNRQRSIKNVKKEELFSRGKGGIIRDYLENGISVGQLCEKYDLHPNIVYKWKKDLFEGALKTFSGEHKQKKPKENKRIFLLETKLKVTSGYRQSKNS